MPSVLRKLLFFRNLLDRRKPEPDEIVQEKWVADFSKPKNVRFDIKSESSYDANLRKNLFYSGHSLVLELKKTGCIAWVEAPMYRYRDLVISGTIRIDARGGYAAGGVNFRMVDNKTYYSFLISTKGYFRLDALRNGMPFPLVGWTELPLFPGMQLSSDKPVDFSIIIYGSHIVILLFGRWAAEISDSSILEGTNCFTAASYDSGDPAYRVIREEKTSLGTSNTAEIFLESFAVESRIIEVSELYEKWHDSQEIDAKARINLAETFTVLNQHNAAMVQLRKAWDTPGHSKTQGELLLAGRVAQTLGLMTEAESYISECFQDDIESPEGKNALTEMARILYTGERFGELKDFCIEALKIKKDDPILWTFKGHAHWNLNEYKNAASAYDRAFGLEKENGIYAKNAANVFDVMGNKKEALTRYLNAGRAFLKAGNHNDLGLLVPVLLSLGKDNWEARSLAGKWAYAVDDLQMAEAEFLEAEKLRSSRKPKPRKDGAQVFLEALLLIKAGNRREALPKLAEAASLEKDYALFHFRHAENLFLLDDDPDDPKMLGEMKEALSLLEKDSGNYKLVPVKDDEELSGWVNNFAAQVALRKGSLDSASKHLDKAVKILGDLPAVRVNQGVLYYLKGSLDKALELLDGSKYSDPEGIMANCAGNLLVRSGRYDEADTQYRKALSSDPGNIEYLSNRASCLIKLNLYGEADELLAKAHSISPSPGLLEMISFVAVKKGEYLRAEQACRSALEMDLNHTASLLSLGWILLTQGRRDEVSDIIRRLDTFELKEDAAKGREELKSRLDDLLYETMECASCDRKWKVLKNPPRIPAIRLYAMPPDDMPAGVCTSCRTTYCIGCAKKNLDPAGRFKCPVCGLFLRLVNDGQRKLIYDWAEANGLIKKEKAAGVRGQGKKVSRKVSVDNTPETVPELAPEPDVPSPVKRPRGRPRKKDINKDTANTPVTEKRGRGRPHKTEKKIEVNEVKTLIKRGRGRPRVR